MKRGLGSRIPQVLFLSCSFLVVAAQSRAQSGAEVDTILFNGKILTVDDRFATAEAVAIEDGKIAAVGTNAEIQKRAGSGTLRIDLKGRTVVPGLVDTHSHVHSYAVSEFGAMLGPRRPAQGGGR